MWRRSASCCVWRHRREVLRDGGRRGHGALHRGERRARRRADAGSAPRRSRGLADPAAHDRWSSLPRHRPPRRDQGRLHAFHRWLALRCRGARRADAYDPRDERRGRRPHRSEAARGSDAGARGARAGAAWRSGGSGAGTRRHGGDEDGERAARRRRRHREGGACGAGEGGREGRRAGGAGMTATHSFCARTARTGILLASFALAAGAGAQGAPDTDVWLAPLSRIGDSLVVGAPRNVTRRPGYDNQPSFTPDSRAILYTAVVDGQAEIFRYDLASGASTRLTSTPESEYSPTVTPDGKWFSVVRVEKDSTQRLWKFPLAGGEPVLVLPGVKPVGYHTWIDDSTLVLFVLGRPATLQLADVHTGVARAIARDVGRSIQRVPGARAFTYVQRDSGFSPTV